MGERQYTTGEENHEFPNANKEPKLPLYKIVAINRQEQKLSEPPEATDMPFVQKTDNKNNVTPVKVYGQVVSCDKDGNGFIKSQYNSILGDIFFHERYYPIGAMVTCDVEKDNSGKFVAKKISYKPKSGTVVSYDVEKKCGYLSGNLHFRNSDIQNNYLVSPGIKVTFDIVSDNGIECAKNIKVLNPFHGKVKTWDKKEGKGSIYIQELEKVVDVVSEDVKNFNHTLLEKAKVKCYLIKDGDKLCAKQVFSKRVACHLPIWCLIVGLVVILISTYKFKINFWIPYLVVINVITIILYLYDKKDAMDHNQRISESILHLVEFGGGSPMAYVCQRALHHKIKDDPGLYYSYPKRFNFILLDQAIILAISGCGTLCFNIPFIDTFIFLFVSSVCAIIIYNLIDMIRKRKD